MRARGIVLAVPLLLAGCAGWLPPSCPAGLKPMTEAELFFGREIAGHAAVGDADWQAFLDEEVTPRFPAGLTVSDAGGQWRGTDGAIVREASKRLTIVLMGTPDEADKLAAIREAYKRRFHQDSVLLVETKTCGSF